MRVATIDYYLQGNPFVSFFQFSFHIFSSLTYIFLTLFHSISREIRSELTTIAEEQSIKVFAHNLRSLLLTPPIRNRKVLGIDPGNDPSISRMSIEQINITVRILLGFVSGCKLAVVDEFGSLLWNGVIFPHLSSHKRESAIKAINEVIDKYGIDLIAIGNATAGRETEEFVVANIIEKRKGKVIVSYGVIDRNSFFSLISLLRFVYLQSTKPIEYCMVDESGASVYSASIAAREEFPNLPDPSDRSAVSIARRLQDPLSELVKIDPKVINPHRFGIILFELTFHLLHFFWLVYWSWIVSARYQVKGINQGSRRCG